MKGNVKLYAIFLGVNGSVLLTEMTSAEKWQKITQILRTNRTERFDAEKRFDGVDCVCVANAYARPDRGYLNTVASHMCGGDIFGNVLVMKRNAIGESCLMPLGKARKMKEAIENEFFYA